MNDLGRIYTRTGDAGKTALRGGKRVSKSDPRVEAYGTVDEVVSALGVAAAAMARGGGPGPAADPPPGEGTGSPGWDELIAIVTGLQRDLFMVGARLAAPGGSGAGTPQTASDRQTSLAPATASLESTIDRLAAGLPPFRRFILPGGGPAGAALHLARTICRRAERRAVALSEEEQVDPDLLAYLNRLSDLLFVLARVANSLEGTTETEWNWV